MYTVVYTVYTVYIYGIYTVVYTVYIYGIFGREIIEYPHGHIRCMYTILASPTYNCSAQMQESACAIYDHAGAKSGCRCASVPSINACLVSLLPAAMGMALFSPLPLLCHQSLLSISHPCYSNRSNCQLLLAASPIFTPATPTIKFVSCC